MVYAGIDYEAILRQAEKEAEIIIWDGGNNDTPFFKPDLHIVLFDPHRAGHERLYFPGETNMRLADVAIITKMGTASAEQVEIVRDNIVRFAPRAPNNSGRIPGHRQSTRKNKKDAASWWSKTDPV